MKKMTRLDDKTGEFIAYGKKVLTEQNQTYGKLRVLYEGE